MARVKLGVISDTHGLMRPEALRELGGVDVILHAGDVGDPEVLASLERVAPVRAVRGNNDVGAWAEALPDAELLRTGGCRVVLIHDVKGLGFDPARAGISIVVAGHSHKPRNERAGGVLWFNPGSAGPRRFSLPPAVGRLEIGEGEVRSLIVTLTAEGSVR